MGALAHASTAPRVAMVQAPAAVGVAGITMAADADAGITAAVAGVVVIITITVVEGTGVRRTSTALKPQKIMRRCMTNNRRILQRSRFFFHDVHSHRTLHVR